MNRIEELIEERSTCLFLLQQAKDNFDQEQAVILAMRIIEIEEEIEQINNNCKYRSK